MYVFLTWPQLWAYWFFPLAISTVSDTPYHSCACANLIISVIIFSVLKSLPMSHRWCAFRPSSASMPMSLHPLVLNPKWCQNSQLHNQPQLLRIPLFERRSPRWQMWNAYSRFVPTQSLPWTCIDPHRYTHTLMVIKSKWYCQHNQSSRNVPLGYSAMSWNP